MIVLLIFFTVIIILLLPFKVKVTFIYQDSKIHIYLFNKQIGMKEKLAEDKTSKRTYKKLRIFADKLTRNKFKPGLSLDWELNYGFEDAALTGISYGIFSTIFGVMYELIGMIFKIKAFKFSINPQFNNPTLNIRISSIISLNLAKIIYIVIILAL